MDAHPIAKLRTAKHLSQAELAKRIGVSQEAICHYEKGRRTPSSRVLLRLSREFGVPMEKLLR